ncbi:phospholipase A2 inhibitor NAI-like [Erythrolamprus reginae]|uniref:phospholipase A2 inhibitor NAI-like n=1 Tax=Erythrolamprus reginae TaxID=121349 RepID=UPI00396CB677
MRAAGILIFCVFFSLLSTVTSLKCQACVGHGTECKEEDVKVEECEENEEFCSTVIFNNTLINPSLSLIVKKCSRQEECMDGFLSITTVDGRFQVARGTCCQTELCNGEPILLEHHHTLKPNGLQCPGCYALDADHCEANETVNCVGEEDQCFNITSSKVIFGKFHDKSTNQGCTTKWPCYFPVGYSEIAEGLYKVNVTTLECRNASSSDPDHH